MRLTICEDSVLLREGLIRLLTEVGHEVVAALPDAVGLPLPEHDPEAGAAQHTQGTPGHPLAEHDPAP